MIGIVALRGRLWEIKREWRRMMENDFTRGVLHGLTLVERLAPEMERSERERQGILLTRFNRTSAKHFWRTILTAEHKLSAGDRVAAEARLKKTIAQFRRDKPQA